MLPINEAAVAAGEQAVSTASVSGLTSAFPDEAEAGGLLRRAAGGLANGQRVRFPGYACAIGTFFLRKN